MVRTVVALAFILCTSTFASAQRALRPTCNVSVSYTTTAVPYCSLAPALSRKEARRAARGRYLEERLPFGRAIVRPVSETPYGLVERARAYLGTNPTGWARVWCGRFMAMIAPEAAARIRNPNMARDWAGLPHVQGRVGVIAVLSRGRNGGHVGVVSGFDRHGNPILISGNHSRRVGEGTYSARRVLAYVSL